MIVLKLPIGRTALVLMGVFAFLAHRVSSEGVLKVLAAAVLFSLLLSAGSTYAGIRHALPVVVLLAVLGGVGMKFAFSSESLSWKAVAGISLAIAAASALPVMRPWECFNEIIRGGSRAYLFFFTGRSARPKNSRAASTGAAETQSATDPGSNPVHCPGL